jgi:hypothetical protein
MAEAEAAGDGGAAVLEVVEASGDAGGVEGPVGVRGGLVWERASRSRCVPSSRSWTWRVHSGTCASWRAAEWRHLGAYAELVARQPVGHPEADEAFDGAPRAPAACERRAQAERLAKLTQVNQGWFALAPQHGQAP